MEILEQIDTTRMQLEDEVKRKIQFNADAQLINFSFTHLGICKAEVIDIYLTNQSTQLRQLVQRLMPLQLKKPHPL